METGASSEVEGFLRSLPPKYAAKVRQGVGRLALFGPDLLFPSSSHVDGRFRGLRTSFAGQQYRVIDARRGDRFCPLAASRRPATVICLPRSVEPRGRGHAWKEQHDDGEVGSDRSRARP